MFNPFPKNIPSFMPIGQKKEAAAAPPLPPNRKSSCTKASTKVDSQESKALTSRSTRHEQCFKTRENSSNNTTNKFGTITLRTHKTQRGERICRSKSAGAVSNVLASLLSTCGVSKSNSTSTAKTTDTKRPSNTVRIARLERHTRLNAATSPTRRRILALRKSSLSPVAFGRSISRERTFAEEKKRLENTLPLSRTTFEASTNILRDPSLKSPQDVKQAIRCYATCPVRMRSKSLPRAKQLTYNPTITINTTTRHTMCYPHVHETKTFESARSLPKSTSLVAPTKVSERSLTRKNVPPTESTFSLARTNSTFSVESKEKTSKLLPKCSSSTKAVKQIQTKTIQNSRSEGNIFQAKRHNQVEKPTKRSTKQNLPVRVTKTTTKPAIVQEKQVAHYFQESLPYTQKTNSLSHESPYSKYISYQNARSVSPVKQIIYSEDDSYSEFGEPSAIDDLVWQYELGSKMEPSLQTPGPIMDIARPESPPLGQKSRKFSPTREIRVPAEYRPLSPTLDWQPMRPTTPTDQKFLATREIRIPQTPRSCSPVHVKHIPRPQTPTLSSSTTFSPTREVRVPPSTRNVRSPSRRKIESCRPNLKNETSKVIRASSLSSADDRSARGLYRCSELAHSATSLSCHDRHSPNCRYRHSKRFTDLNRFYNTLERVGQLERATSATNFKPIRKDSELLDFDEWRKVRLHERAERELNYLVNKLKQDQRENDLVFRAKDVDDIKWRRETDFSLHSREKSVEDLREDFEKKQFLKDFDFSSLHAEREFIRPYYRRNTVADLTSSLEEKLSLTEQNNAQEHNQLLSTLSKDDKCKISKQLNEIYANNSKLNKEVVSEEYVVTVDRYSRPKTTPNALKVRCNSSISRDELMGPVMRKKQALTNSPAYRPNQYKEVGGDQKPQRSISPVHLGRETRGAIAAKNADVRRTKPPEIPPLPLPETTTSQAQKNSDNGAANPQTALVKTTTARVNDTEAPLKDSSKHISEKIQFFESRQFDEPAKTVYHAREDSSPDENEVLQLIEENIKSREKEKIKHSELSSSLTDLKDMFGERSAARVCFYHSDDHDQHVETHADNGTDEFSPPVSFEIYDTYYRSRSLSPNSESSSYLQRVQTGDVQKIKEKFESLGETKGCDDFFGFAPLRKARSDPEFNALDSGSKDALETSTANDKHTGDVSWITHQLEVRNQSLSADEARGRCRNRRLISPTPLKNRLMPHIDIISKRAALKVEVPKNLREDSPVQSVTKDGMVERMRNRYECTGSRYISLSNPDVSDVSTMTKHLTADWIAHKYPNPKQNTYLTKTNVKLIDIFDKPTPLFARSSSTSPPRPPKSKCHQTTALLNSTRNPFYADIFANQKFDPSMHKPKARYVPDGAETGSDWKTSLPRNVTIIGGSSSMTFQGS